MKLACKLSTLENIQKHVNNLYLNMQQSLLRVDFACINIYLYVVLKIVRIKLIYQGDTNA